MKTIRILLLLPFLGASALAQGKRNAEAFGRVFIHLDGTRTESFKHGDKNTIEELTYKNDVLHVIRVFTTDSMGRTRVGVIYDGKRNPLGSIQFGYDPATDQLVEERQFNSKGQMIRRLFYPGAIKDRPEFAKQFVAFTYDPDRPKAAPVQDKQPAKPTKPVESNQDEFEPGIPINPGSASARSATEPRAPAPAHPAAAPGKRTRSFFAPKKS